MNGWIALHRTIQDHWLFSFNQPDKALAWIDLLLSASHSDHTFPIKGRPVRIRRGQVALSQITMQKRWRWSQNKVKRFLNRLKTERMIEFETNDLTTIVTILNYNAFQDHLKDNGQPPEEQDGRPNERKADDQSNDQSNDNQQGNNVKKVKKKDLFDEEISVEEGFQAFWNERWSRRPASNPRAETEKAYAKARKIVKHEVIMDGLRAYPFETDPDRLHFNPMGSTWLNKKRWIIDEEDEEPTDEKKQAYRLKAYQKQGIWLEEWGPIPQEALH